MPGNVGLHRRESVVGVDMQRARLRAQHSVPTAAIVAICLAACAPGHASSDRAPGRRELGRSGNGGTVTVSDVTSLSFVGLPRAPQFNARVFRLPDGGWGVSSEQFGSVIQRFDSAGAPVGTVGHRGQGPGEFRGTVFGVTVGDDLWVVNPGNGRVSLFSKGLAFLRSRPLPYRVFSVSPVRRGSGLLLSGFFHSAGSDTTGWRSVARVSMDGAADAFGGDVPDTPEIPKLEMQFAAATAAGEVWTVATIGGAVDVLRMDDLSVIERFQLPGVPYADELRPRVPGSRSRTPPPPEVAGITGDGRGLLWVLIGVPDADWTPAMRASVDGINAMIDMRVLAIDPVTRTVVGARLLDDVCFPAGGALISCVNEADQVIRVRELALVRQ